MSLPVPHYQQASPHTCLPACARMILDFHGFQHSEAELAQTFHSIPHLGTQPDNVIKGLEDLGYHALWFENTTIERLLELLAANWPVIVFVRAQDLSYGRAGLHAVVLIGIENSQVIYLDPTRETRSQLELASFARIWSKLGNQGMVIWK